MVRQGAFFGLGLGLLLSACDTVANMPPDAGTAHRDASDRCRLRSSTDHSPECPRCQPGDDSEFFTRPCIVGHLCRYRLGDTSIGGFACNCMAESDAVDAGGAWECLL